MKKLKCLLAILALALPLSAQIVFKTSAIARGPGGAGSQSPLAAGPSRTGPFGACSSSRPVALDLHAGRGKVLNKIGT